MHSTESNLGIAQGPRLIGDSTSSAVSWGAIFAGAVIGAALTAALVTLGAGLGFLAISPWRNDGASGSTMAMGTIAWLFATQIIAYGVAGYVTGRLRTKWSDIRGDEVYFRDTAHGFLVWALSSLIGVVLLGSAVASIVSSTAQAGANFAGASAGAVAAIAGKSGAQADGELSLDYFTDSLLRSSSSNQAMNQNDARREVSLIFGRSLSDGKISAEDQQHLIKLISERAGISESEAEQRINQITSRAKQAADEFELKAREAADQARKAAASFALWAFASLLVGAFVASFAATRGGRARDF